MAISNNSTGLRPGVCTSTNRPTTPYEGQVIYETDTDLSYVYNGSSWQQITGGTAVGNSGLVYVKSHTITSGTSVVVTDAFSSTYDNYRVVVSNGVTTSNAAISLQLGPTSVSGYNTSYYSTTIYATYAGGAPLNANVNNGSTWTYSGYAWTGNGILLAVELGGPNLARFTSVNNGYSGSDGATTNGYHGSTSQFTGFTLAGLTFTSGTVTVYGYRKA